MIDPKSSGSYYKGTHKKDLQLIETAIEYTSYAHIGSKPALYQPQTLSKEPYSSPTHRSSISWVRKTAQQLTV